MALENKILADRLRRALVNGDTTAFRRLVKGGVDVNERYWYGSTLLHEAVMTGKVDLVQILLVNRADVNSINEDGRSALHLAVRAQKTEIVKQLIKHGADVNHRTNDGKTALHVAAWKKNVDLCRLLLKSGANPNVRDKDGCLPMYWAARWNIGPLLNVFLEHDSLLEIVQLHGKASRGLTEWKYILNTNPDVFKLLMIHGGDVDNLMPELMRVYLKDTAYTCTDKLQTVQFCFKCGCQFTKPLRQHLREWTLASDVVSADVQHNRVLPVQSLSSVCRIQIRRQLKSNSGGTSILKLIETLPIPKILINYLMFRTDMEALSVT